MSERIYHAGKARQILAEIPEGATEAGTMAWCAEAQVHATLAIAEQARVANLIAYSTMLDLQYQMANERGEANITFAPSQEELDASLARKDAAQAEIAAALGLTAEQERDNDEG